jgi:hypothetical protein
MIEIEAKNAASAVENPANPRLDCTSAPEIIFMTSSSDLP